jgi:hypothetical protein
VRQKVLGNNLWKNVVKTLETFTYFSRHEIGGNHGAVSPVSAVSVIEMLVKDPRCSPIRGYKLAMNGGKQSLGIVTHTAG